MKSCPECGDEAFDDSGVCPRCDFRFRPRAHWQLSEAQRAMARVVACPYCLEPLSAVNDTNERFEAPPVCPHCERDPRNDAMHDLAAKGWDLQPTRPCPSCETRIHALAVVCFACRTPPQTEDPAEPVDPEKPRPQPYTFAHRVLRDRAHRRPRDTWSALTGPEAEAQLAKEWERAAGDGPSTPAIGLGVEGVVVRDGWEILLVRTPPPLAATEAHFIALARRPENAFDLGYFVMERGLPDEDGDRAYLAEWRSDDARIRMGDLPAVTREAFLDAVVTALVGRGKTAFGPAVPPKPEPRRPNPPSRTFGVTEIVVIVSVVAILAALLL